MSIHAEEKRTINVPEFAVVTNPLSDCQDVPLVEGHVHCRSAMAGRTKDNPLSRITRIGPQLVVGCKELRHIHQDGGISRLPGRGANIHFAPHQGVLPAAGGAVLQDGVASCCRTLSTMARTFTNRTKCEPTS